MASVGSLDWFTEHLESQKGLPGWRQSSKVITAASKTESGGCRPHENGIPKMPHNVGRQEAERPMVGRIMAVWLLKVPIGTVSIRWTDVYPSMLILHEYSMTGC